MLYFEGCEQSSSAECPYEGFEYIPLETVLLGGGGWREFL